MTTFTMTTTEPTSRVYIRKRKAGWYAISHRVIDANTEETTVIGPMSREDAVVVRNSFKHDAEVSHD